MPLSEQYRLPVARRWEGRGAERQVSRPRSSTSANLVSVAYGLPPTVSPPCTTATKRPEAVLTLHALALVPVRRLKSTLPTILNLATRALQARLLSVSTYTSPSELLNTISLPVFAGSSAATSSSRQLQHRSFLPPTVPSERPPSFEVLRFLRIQPECRLFRLLGPPANSKSLISHPEASYRTDRRPSTPPIP